MRLRLSLARALLTRPQVIVLDEPTRSLDPVIAEDFLDRIAQLVRQDDVAVLLASHDLTEVAALADRALVFRSGRVTGVFADPSADGLLHAMKASA